MREQYMRKGEGFIICYSITDRRSFEEAVEYKKLIDTVRNRDDIPVVLVGNKRDLEQARKVREDFRIGMWCLSVMDSCVCGLPARRTRHDHRICRAVSKTPVFLGSSI